ncbi:MAG: Xaa-Pro peptidase family protein [Bacillota bacterium]|nr:Xaa-Pro peptidase family protein [Bacillota bacterium]MDW7683395.1 Xaa-Pro peptidase family protein [Bacillota bacterium]
MVPSAELNQRKGVLQEKLRSANLDGILLAHNMSMYYFSGTMQCQYVYISAEGESLGLVRKNMGRAKDESPITFATLKGFSGLPALLAEYGHKPTFLGLELDVLPAAVYLRLAEILAGTKLTDASLHVRQARQVKSAYELEQFREAARQVDALHRAVPQLLTEGVEELELAARLEFALRRMGHQGVARMRGFNQEMFFGHVLSGREGAAPSFLDSPTGGVGLSAAQPQGAGRRKIAAGEPVTVDYGGIYNGYIVDQTRLYSIGALPDTLMRAFEASLAVQEAVCALLKPGISGAEIFDAACSVAEKFNLAEHFMGFGDAQAKYVGHGVGLEFDEFPILAKKSPHLVLKDTVVAVEPKFTFPGLGVVGIENTWHVTENGVVKISLTPDSHVIL